MTEPLITPSAVRELKAAWIVPLLFGACACAVGAGALSAVGHALAHPGARTLLQALYELLRTVVAVLFTRFTIGRAPARRRARDPLAFAACVVAMGALLAFREPPADTPAALIVAGEALAVAACVFLTVSVARLGRCFGVLPEARGLVRSGPYAIVRHPVYAAELGAYIGLALAAPLLINAVVLAVVFAAQCARMRFEERALKDAFPEYASYAQAVPRLLPSPRRVRAYLRSLRDARTYPAAGQTRRAKTAAARPTTALVYIEPLPDTASTGRR